MHYTLSLGLLLASSLLAAAVPAETTVLRNPLRRLIKTSEADAGTWVTEEEKITKYVAKNIGFIDITDIKV